MRAFFREVNWAVFKLLLLVTALSAIWYFILVGLTGCASRDSSVNNSVKSELQETTNAGLRARVAPSLGASQVSDQELVLDPARQVLIVGPIMEGGAQTAGRILDLGKKPGNIDVVINSPGGMVTTGLMILDAMEVARANGAVVRCLVVGKAFSMAFNLLPSCSEVYALPNTELLFHPVRIQAGMGAVLTAFIAQQVVDMLLQTERRMIPRLVAWTGFNFETFIKHYVDETMWSPDQLASASGAPIRIVTNVKGLDGGVFAWPKERKGLFNVKGQSVTGRRDRDATIRFYKQLVGGAE